MDSRTVTFGRRGATLVLRRERTADGVALVAIESGRPRTFCFTHLRQLLRFQRDMEAFLQRTGWSPVDAPAADPATVPAAAAAAVAVEDDDNGLRLTLAEEEVAARR
jgi:hypothetical protein